jgi:hypothetical protein
MADGVGSSLVEGFRHLFFRIVNQVLVRLWARRWWEIRAIGCLPLVACLQAAGIAKSDRPRSGWVATPGGIQPSDRRQMCSEAFWRIAGCDGRWFVVCKLSSSIDVWVCRIWSDPGVDGSCT